MTVEEARQLGRLQERIARQRQDLAQAAAPLRTLCAWADRTGACLNQGAQYVQRHPGQIMLGTLLLVLARPRRAWRWARRGWLVWQTWQQLRRRLPF